MNLQAIYNVAKASVDYDTFKIRIAKIYNLCPTDATEIEKLNNLHLTHVSVELPELCSQCASRNIHNDKVCKCGKPFNGN